MQLGEDHDIGVVWNRRTHAQPVFRVFDDVLQFILKNFRLVSFANTRAGRKLFFRLEKERNKLMQAFGEATPKMLADKLDVSEDDEPEEIDDDDPLAAERHLYGFLSWLLEWTVRALSAGLQD